MNETQTPLTFGLVGGCVIAGMFVSLGIILCTLCFCGKWKKSRPRVTQQRSETINETAENDIEQSLHLQTEHNSGELSLSPPLEPPSYNNVVLSIDSYPCGDVEYAHSPPTLLKLSEWGRKNSEEDQCDGTYKIGPPPKYEDLL